MAKGEGGVAEGAWPMGCGSKGWGPKFQKKILFSSKDVTLKRGVAENQSNICGIFWEKPFKTLECH